MRALSLVLSLMLFACSSEDAKKSDADTSIPQDLGQTDQAGDQQSDVTPVDVAPDVADVAAPDILDQTSDVPEDMEPGDLAEEVDVVKPITVDDPLDFVNPFIGSGGEGYLIGSGTPAATMPFGMVKLGPDTMDTQAAPYFYHCSGYWYPDKYIIGFSHLHLFGTGAQDYGVLLANPIIGISDAQTDPMNYRHTFSKENEHAEVGLYRVTTDQGITAQLSATERTGIHRYTWPQGAQRVVLIDAGHALADCEVKEAELAVDVEAKEVTGRIKYCGGLSCGHGGFNLFFVARFDQTFIKAGTWDDAGTLKDELTCSNKGCGAYFDFGTGTDAVDLKVGVSFVDVDGARANLMAEADAITLEDAVNDARDVWREMLNTIKVKSGGTYDQLVIFYTSLYHSFFMPDIASDVDGRYRGMDREVHNMGDRVYYTDFSIWDTFRTLHPLLVLLAPDHQADMVASLVKMYDEGGAYPRWPIADHESGCMIGTHADIVVADSFLKGIPVDDPSHAFDGLFVTATGPKPEGAVGAGRADIWGYVNVGYCRADHAGRSVSWTLEITHDDFALAQMAKALDRQAEYEQLLAQSENYRNLWNDEYGFFLPKNGDGSWTDLGRPFDPTRWEDWYTEGGAWQYLWYVPHNPSGLAELMGGPEAMLERLDEFFKLSIDFENSINALQDILPRPYYWHGNEPDMHAAYLYSALGRQDKAAEVVRWIMRAHYKNAPQGIPGNDDCGTMSSWYVFSAMGFLPIPGTDLYYLGIPLFAEATMKIQDKQLTIIAQGPLGDDAKPVETWFNGVKLDKPQLTWQQLKEGGELKFVLE